MLIHELFTKFPYSRFKEFIAPGIDRFDLLCSILDEGSLPKTILEIEGKRHIMVSRENPGLSPGNHNKTFIILTAHYDRVANSPGANDNAAAVFQLLEAALRIHKAMPPPSGNVLFIFTDGEELSAGESLSLQGSYGLGLFLIKNGMGNSRIFSFDACGTGDTLIVSTAADLLLKNETSPGADAARRKVQDLRHTALEAARKAHLENVQLLPTPFSEDAGFLLAGMAAQTITVLPQKEAAAAAALARKGKSAVLLSNAIHDRRLIPETWQCLNSPADSPLRLTPEHWKKISAFVSALAET